MGEGGGGGWMERWEDGGTAICLCVLTHCPSPQPGAQIRRGDTLANCDTCVFVFLCVCVCVSLKRRSLHI